MDGGVDVFRYTLDGLRQEGLDPIPLVWSTSSHEHTVAATATRDRFVVFRVDVKALSPEESLTSVIEGFLRSYSVSPEDTVIILDFRDVASLGSGMYARMLAAFTDEVSALGNFSAMVGAGSSVPQSMSGLEQNKVSRRPRLAWQGWQSYRRLRISNGEPVVAFSDYGIDHPEIVDIDPRLMTMTASIRYTADDDYLLSRGVTIKKAGWSQTQALCKSLVALPEFKGRTFSAGDLYIANRSEGRVTSGNATTWRQVGTNHHLHLVVDQIANLDEP